MQAKEQIKHFSISDNSLFFSSLKVYECIKLKIYYKLTNYLYRPIVYTAYKYTEDALYKI